MPRRLGFVIKSPAERIIHGSVYAPWLVDTDREAMVPAEIEKAAKRFVEQSRFGMVDVQHRRIPAGCQVIESYIAGPNDPDFRPGEWVARIKVHDDKVWAMVENGEVNSFSFWGPATRNRYPVILAQPVEGNGTTESNSGGPFPDHVHGVSVKFDANARIIPVFTGENHGHRHHILSTTVTDPAVDHVHKLVLDVGQ